ncbi:NIPSNAP protein [Micromonospora rhizosphaerae]|uniref:NIPSNAP protein n=1 Tax=Micromonospora rhizosphaerae TaxID=568872 RepID=A0A1C6S1U0_9ACTN|nr:NIPSNAP family protein [Micromonospora rhizosphaerae]SCL23300.1 NIPSNAP protein [Micromonospora rhizosphaerae]
MTVVELRQYTLHSGQRDVLIDLFDQEFVESQEAVGMQIIGQFRDVNDPDRFVWLRAFPDMDSRAAALTAFYLEGPVWKAHGPAANATMVDSSNALLLRPVRAGSGFPPPIGPRPPLGATETPDSRVVATLYYRDAAVDDEFVRFFDDHVAPVMAELGAHPLACLETEPAPNTFPRLPVRTGENVFVWFARLGSPAHHRAYLDGLARSERWNEEVLPELLTRLASAPQQLTLAPTARSQLH